MVLKETQHKCSRACVSLEYFSHGSGAPVRRCGLVEKVKGSTVRLTGRLMEGSSSWVSREVHGDEENLEAGTAHINEEYMELQEFEAHEERSFRGLTRTSLMRIC